MSNSDRKPVIDMLQEDIKIIQERINIIESKIKRWRDKTLDPKTVILLSEMLNFLEKIPDRMMLISLAVACAQAEIHQSKKKEEEK